MDAGCVGVVLVGFQGDDAGVVGDDVGVGGQSVVVEARIGDGPWRKQGGGLTLTADGSGEWTGIVAGARRQDGLSLRVVTPYGTTKPSTFGGR